MKVICCNVGIDKDSPCDFCLHSKPHDVVLWLAKRENCDDVLKYCPDWKEEIKNVCRCVPMKGK